MSVFSEAESLGSQSDTQIRNYLREIRVLDGELHPGGTGQGVSMPWDFAAWKETGAILGFIETKGAVANHIRPISEIKADTKLRGRRVKVTLDQFYVHEYPGRGEHRILLEFAGKNQVDAQAEDLRFAVNTLARDKSTASLVGLPIFLGLTLGANGISFEGRTVNVSSSDDDLVLNVLNDDAFKQGLSLIDKVQPALRPLAKLAEGVVRLAASRSSNKQVFNFHLGLDFVGSGTSARLRCGSYVVVQCGRQEDWDWASYKWEPNSRRIVPTEPDGDGLPYNYMVFGVTEFMD